MLNYGVYLSFFPCLQEEMMKAKLDANSKTKQLLEVTNAIG